MDIGIKYLIFKYNITILHILYKGWIIEYIHI